VASLLIEGIASETQPVPEGATLSLTSNLGELSTTDCSAASAGHRAVVGKLTAGVAWAIVCLPDRGGTAMITARSGSVSELATLAVPPIPRQLDVVASPVHAAAGERATFTAYASDCAGQAAASVPLSIQVTAGSFELDAASAGPIRTGADGSVTIAGTVRVAPLKLHVAVIGATQIACLSTIEGDAP
jgi:hypothetical protein